MEASEPGSVLGCTPFPQESAGHVLEISTPAGAEPIIIIPPHQNHTTAENSTNTKRTITIKKCLKVFTVRYNKDTVSLQCDGNNKYMISVCKIYTHHYYKCNM